MDGRDLSGARVAILATHGFERSELEEPLRALRDAGARVEVVSPEAGEIRSWEKDHWGDSFPVDRTLDAVETFDDYDALVLPGGQINPDVLRLDARAVAFVRAMVESGKVVGAICHGPWLLAEADVLAGRTVTAWPSVRTDLRNAGARVVDEAVVVDGRPVTSRKPDDPPAFCDRLAAGIAAARRGADAAA